VQRFTSKVAGSHPQLPGWFCPQLDTPELNSQIFEPVEKKVVGDKKATGQPDLDLRIFWFWGSSAWLWIVITTDWSTWPNFDGLLRQILA